MGLITAMTPIAMAIVPAMDAVAGMPVGTVAGTAAGTVAGMVETPAGMATGTMPGPGGVTATITGVGLGAMVTTARPGIRIPCTMTPTMMMSRRSIWSRLRRVSLVMIRAQA